MSSKLEELRELAAKHPRLKVKEPDPDAPITVVFGGRAPATLEGEHDEDRESPERDSPDER